MTRNLRHKLRETNSASGSRRQAESGGSPEPAPGWTFLSNHAHVVFCLAEDPGIVLREVAQRVGITERAVQRIVADLDAAGYLTRERVGRSNVYRVHGQKPLRHPIESHRTVADLIALVLGGGGARPEK